MYIYLLYLLTYLCDFVAVYDLKAEMCVVLATRTLLEYKFPVLVLVLDR